MADLPNDPELLVFFGIVRGTSLVGVQTNYYQLTLTGSAPGVGTFSVQGFTLSGHSMNNFLRVEQDPANQFNIRICARYNGVAAGAPADALRAAMLAGGSMTGSLLAPNGSAVVGALTIHFRSVSSIDYFSLAGGATAVTQIGEAANFKTPGAGVTVTGPVGWTATSVAVTGGQQLQVNTNGAPLGAATNCTLNFANTVNGQISRFDGVSPIVLYTLSVNAAATAAAVQPNVARDALAPVVEIKQTSALAMPYQLTIPASTTTNTTVNYSYWVSITDEITGGVGGHIPVHGTSGAKLELVFKLRHKHNPTGSTTTVTATVANAASAFTISGLPPGITSSSLTGSATTEDFVSSLTISGTLVLDGSIESVTLNVVAQDRRGNVATFAGGATASRHTIVAIPTDVALVLDYSGSMRAINGGQSKWAATAEAARLFNRMYGLLKPTPDDTLDIITFYNNGGNQQTSSGKTDPATMISVTSTDPDPMNYTPIGHGLTVARGDLQAAGTDNSWRNRVVFVMTDGIENRAPLLDEIRDTANANHLPGYADGSRTGFTVYGVAFGAQTQISTGELQQVVDGGGMNIFHYDGELFSTQTADDPNDPDTLEKIFVNLLPSAIPVEQVPRSGSTFTVEPGVEKAIFISSSTAAFTVTPPSGSPINNSGPNNGITWVSVSNPAAGAYTVSGGGAGKYCLVDLSLRTRFEALRTTCTVGTPITLRATIHQSGAPVSGAIVEVEVRRPGESIGEMTTTLVQSQPAQQLPLALPGASHYVTLQTVQRIGSVAGATRSPNHDTHGHASGKPISVDPPGLVYQLFAAAEQLRGFPLRIASNRIRLVESPIEGGVYEATFFDTSLEGTYTFDFSAEGSLPGGDFRRARSIARHVETTVDGEQSGVSWTPQVVASGQVNWTGVLTLRTPAGTLIGPGRGPQLAVLAVSGKDPQPLQVNDPLNGSYTVSLTLPAGASPPRIVAGQHGQPGGLVNLDPGKGGGRCRHVRVVLNRVHIKDAHEPWFKGAGELVFNSAASPNGDPDRTQLKRVPQRGHLELKSGESQRLKDVLFDGHLIEGESLLLQIGGAELDCWFDANDKLMRFARRFTGPIATWAGSYAPDDEPNDPESLRDWKVWYTVVVE